MGSLWLITKKNVQLLIRSKGSSLIVIFAPLFIILLLGLSYNTSEKYGITIGVYAPSYSDDVNSFVTLLEEKEFSVIKYDGSIDRCTNDIKKGLVHTCISLPESLHVQDNTPKEITFYVDPSRINVVWMVQETVKEKFSLKAQEISQGITQDILNKLADTKIKVSEKNSELTTVKDKNNAATSAAQTAKSGLTGIDTSLPVTIYDTTSLATLNAELSNTKGKIDEALVKVAKTNASAGDKAAIKIALDEASAKISNATALLNGPESTSVTSVIELLKTDVESLKSKLTSAATAISTSSSQLDTTQATLSESIAALDTVQSALTTVVANIESQKITSAGTIVAPLITRVEKIGEEGTYLNYLFPALLVIVVMFTSLLLGTTLVMMEKNSPAFLRNFFLPVRKITFIAATYCTTLLLMVIELVIILGLAFFFLDSSLTSFASIALVLLLAASIFTFLGMLLGYLFSSEETGVLAAISLGSILLFASGVILPLEGISPSFREISFFNPFVMSEGIIHELLLFHAPLEEVVVDVSLLLGYAVILFLIILILESVLHKHLIQHFMKHHHRKHRAQEKKAKSYW